MIKKSKTTAIERSKDVLGGEPVFKGTRVPIRTFIDYLKAGDNLDHFLDDFPTVTKEQVIDILETVKKGFARVIASSTR